MARDCKSCSSPHVALLDDLIRSGATGAAIIRRMAEVDETIDYGHIKTHKQHILPAEQSEELQQLQRELEAEAAASPATVSVLYRALARGVEHLQHSKPPTVQEMAKLTESISRIAGIGTKNELLMAYMERRFSPENIARAEAIAAEQRAQQDHRVNPLLMDFDEEEV